MKFQTIAAQQVEIDSSRVKLSSMKKRIHNLELENNKLSSKPDGYYLEILQSMFTEDQIRALEIKKYGGKRVQEWSSKTIKKALKTKFTCGRNGYEELLNGQNLPLPCLRTLRKKLEALNFEPGILEEIFTLLAEKIKTFPDESAKDCGLYLDEMAITAGRFHDPQTNFQCGSCTLPESTEEANHALALVIAGLSCRWKQIIGYHFTGPSTPGNVVWEELLKIIQKSESIGLSVNFITADMGPVNMGFWKLHGITAGRHSQTKNSIQHPFDPNRRLWFFADPLHILKNILTGLENNRVVYISDDDLKLFGLKSNVINFDHVIEILNLQKDDEYKLTPKAKSSDVDVKNTFKKMRVDRACHIISNPVSSAVEFTAISENRPELETTAWFLKIVSQWFKLVTARKSFDALGKLNPEVYENNIAFLRMVEKTFATIKVGKGDFKPWQKGLIITTNSVIELSEYLLEQRGYKYVLTGFFSTDLVENLFSVMRSKNEIPNALQFKNNLKLVSVSHYMKEVKNSNYAYDDGEYLLDFLEKKKKKKKIETPQQNITIEPDSVGDLNFREKNALYYVAGYLMMSIKKNYKTCECCIFSAGSHTVNRNPYSTFVRLNAYKQEKLFYVNIETYNFFLEMDKIFRAFFKKVRVIPKCNMISFFLSKFAEIKGYNHFLNCHNLKHVIEKRFVTFKLKSKNYKCDSTKFYNSKTMAMHSL